MPPTDALRAAIGAIERLENVVRLLLASKPVRDVPETYGEAAWAKKLLTEALRATPPTTNAEVQQAESPSVSDGQVGMPSAPSLSPVAASAPSSEASIPESDCLSWQQDVNELAAARNVANELRSELSTKAFLKGKQCPNCCGSSYYWLNNSGKCTDCNFHWGMK